MQCNYEQSGMLHIEIVHLNIITYISLSHIDVSLYGNFGCVFRPAMYQ